MQLSIVCILVVNHHGMTVLEAKYGMYTGSQSSWYDCVMQLSMVCILVVNHHGMIVLES